MPATSNKTTRNICFTLFEPFPEFPIKFDEDIVKYAIYQVEKAPETGKLHIQGYMEFKDSKRFAAIKKVFGREDIHLEARRGNRDQARDYCRKEESRVDGPWEFGSFGKGQGARSDLLSVKAAIDKGATENDLFDSNFATMVRYSKGIGRYLQLKQTPRSSKTLGVLFLGPPRVGKTTFLMQEVPGAYWHSSAMGSWFDAYRDEKVAIFDDVYANIPFTQYLGLIDSKPYIIQCKGGSINWKPEKVYVVANTLPELWYKNERGQYDMAAFYGRFEEFWWMDEDREIQKFQSAPEFVDFVKSKSLSDNAQVEPRSPVV